MDKRELEQPVEEPAKKTKKELLAIEREAARIEREAALKARKEAQELQKQQREEARALEKQQREQAKLEKQRQKVEAKAAKEQERKAQREAKEREKEAQREAKEREKEAQREAKERERTAQQPGLGAFFSIFKKSTPNASHQASASDSQVHSEYQATFLEYHIKANCEIIDPVPLCESPADSLEWLRSRPPFQRAPSITPETLKTQLNLGHDPAELVKNVQLRHIQLAETVRPAFVGTVQEIEPQVLAQLRLDPSAQLLDLDYEYDSDLEWVAGDEDGEDLLEDEPSEDEGEMSDIESFLASDDEGPMRKRAIMVSDPMIRWNDGTDPEFSQFSIKVFAPTPVKPGSYKVLVPAPAPPKSTDLPQEAVTAILKGIQGHTGTKALLLESLYHNLHKEFTILTRSGLKSVVDTHAKREKTGWIVNPEKLHLLGQ